MLVGGADRSSVLPPTYCSTGAGVATVLLLIERIATSEHLLHCPGSIRAAYSGDLQCRFGHSDSRNRGGSVPLRRKGLVVRSHYLSLLREAQKQMSAFPQYDQAYWDEYTLMVKANSRLCTKMGLAFEKGDFAIARPPLIKGMVVWSFRNQCATELPTSSFTLQESPTWKQEVS